MFRRAYRDRIAGLVHAAVARGDLPPQDPALTAAALVGAMGEALIGPTAPGSTAPGDEAGRQLTLEALIAFVRRGVGASTVEAPVRGS